MTPTRASRGGSQARMLAAVGFVGVFCIVRQMLSVAAPLEQPPTAVVQQEAPLPALAQGSELGSEDRRVSVAVAADRGVSIDDLAGVDLETVLENLVADFRLAEESLECSNYAGPMFLPYNPGGHIRKKNSIRAAKLPDALEAQPTLRPTRWPLAPFSVHDVRLLPGSRFAAAEATNLAFLWRSW